MFRWSILLPLYFLHVVKDQKLIIKFHFIIYIKDDRNSLKLMAVLLHNSLNLSVYIDSYIDNYRYLVSAQCWMKSSTLLSNLYADICLRSMLKLKNKLQFII